MKNSKIFGSSKQSRETRPPSSPTITDNQTKNFKKLLLTVGAPGVSRSAEKAQLLPSFQTPRRSVIFCREKKKKNKKNGFFRATPKAETLNQNFYEVIFKRNTTFPFVFSKISCALSQFSYLCLLLVI